MNWIFDQPVYIVACGVLAVGLLGYLWTQTRHKYLLLMSIAALLLTIGLLIVERMVETDQEKIRFVLHDIAELLEEDRLDQALRHAYPDSPAQRTAGSELPRYEFSTVNIKSNLEIQFEDQGDAQVSFNVVVAGSSRDGSLSEQRVPRFVITRFRKDGEQWKVYDYEHHPPMMGMQKDVR